MKFINEKWLILILICYYLTSGLIFSFLIPPFQKPDAHYHFIKVASLANLNFFCLNKNQKIREDFLFLLGNPSINSIPHNYSSKMPSSLYKMPAKTQKVSHGLINNCPQLREYINYLIPVIVYKVFENLPINGAILLGLMRFFILIFSLALILAVISKSKNVFNKGILLFVVSLPMTLYQLSSFSYDVGHLVFGLVFITLLLNFLDEKGSTIKNFSLLVISFYLFVFSKPLYEYFYLSLFLLPKEKLKKLRIQKWLFLLVVFVSIFLFRFVNYQSVVGNFNVNIQKEIFLENPFRLFSILEKTFIVNFEFYIESVIGNLGWLDFNLDYFIYLCFLVCYGFLIGFFLKKVKIDQSQFLVFFSIFLLNFFAIFSSLFLTWTPPGDSMVIGVQGRYLLILIPFFTLSLVYLIQKHFKSLIIFIFVLVISLYVRSVYYRYFDYSVYAKPTKNLLLSKKPYILIQPKSEKTFIISEKFNGACYGVFLKFKNKKFDAPIKVEISDLKRKQIVYYLVSQVNYSKEPSGVSFPKTQLQPPIFVKVINKYSSKPVMILDDVALNCIQDYWY